MNILFITSNRIGDAILSTSLLEKTLKDHPSAHVTLAAGPLAIPLFRHTPHIRDLWSFPKEPYGYHWWRLWKKARPFKWDLIIDLRGSLISSFLWAKKRVVWTSQNQTLHKVESLSALVDKNPPHAPYVHIGPEEEALAHKLLDSKTPVIALGLGANWSGKIWPIERFATLAKQIASPQGYYPKASFLLLGSPEEKKLGDLFLAHIPSSLAQRCLNKIGDLDLLETAACLRQSCLFIGNDSGLMHLAAASLCPTLGLFGPSNPIHYRPWGPRAHFVRTDLSYEELWPQRHTLKKDETLMTGLSTQKVYEELGSLLQKGCL